MSDIKPGDRVADLDPGLAQMRDIMRNATGVEPEPNHYGVVREISDDTAYIDYDDGLYAPCPLTQLAKLEAGDDV